MKMRIPPIDAAENCGRGHQEYSGGQIRAAVGMEGQLLFTILKTLNGFADGLFD